MHVLLEIVGVNPYRRQIGEQMSSARGTRPVTGELVRRVGTPQIAPLRIVLPMPEYKAIERDRREENRENQNGCCDNQKFLHASISSA